MATIQEYKQTSSQQVSNKRKYSECFSDENTNSSDNLSFTNLTTDNELEQPAKRRQPKELFRPWLLPDNNERKHRKLAHIEPYIVKYHPNKVRSFQNKERTPKEQKRRDRNTLNCLLSRRAKKIEERLLEQQYLEYRIQLEAVDRETLIARLYLQELQRLAAASYVVPNFTAAHQQMYDQTAMNQEAPTLFVFPGQ